MPTIELADGRKMWDCRTWNVVRHLIVKHGLSRDLILTIGVSREEWEASSRSVRHQSTPIESGYSRLSYDAGGCEVSIVSVPGLPNGVVLLVMKDGRIYAAEAPAAQLERSREAVLPGNGGPRCHPRAVPNRD